MRDYLGIFISVLLLSLPVVLKAQQNTPKDSRLEQLTRLNGWVIYSAIFSLPQTHHIFLDAAGDEAWQTYQPGDMPLHLSDEQKANILSKSALYLKGLTEYQQHQYLGQLVDWIISERQLQIYKQLTSVEQTLAVYYQIHETRSFFKPYLQSRGLDLNTDPKMVAATLSSAEGSEITYQILNRLALMNQKEKLTFFRNFYDHLIKDLPKW
ncbi:MAG TPA: hypothetical protein VJ991_07270 [Balneolales bacterium]|nr:hypothetical protein [Balneolales bacterium]